MKRILKNKRIFQIATILSVALFPSLVNAQGIVSSIVDSFFKLSWEAFAEILGWASVFLLQIVSAITYLSGTILNYIIWFSVVRMKGNVDAAGIDAAWGVVRDVANMGFIFILLYAAIMTIIGQGQDNKKLIVNVVIAAVLVNFSLFFTKLIIDAANMLALLFYGAMVPASALTTGPDSLFVNTGLANSLMEPLRIQSIWQAAGGITGTQLLLVGVLGSVLALVAAFVFFAVAILFVIRFVVLLFVMVLSPIAFLAQILPLTKKYRDQWWEALSGQAFFAPIYFLLTWIVISISQKLANTIGTGSLAEAIAGTASQKVIEGGGTALVMNAPAPETIGVLVNFLIIIALLIASLMIAKEWANKAGASVGKLTSWATGVAGGATMGLAGRFGRGTLGAAGSAFGDSEKLKAAAAKGGATGMAARLALVTSRKTAGASFDFRGTALGGTLDAGKAQKGGYTEAFKKSAERKKKFGESLVPSDITIDEAEQALKNASSPAERFTARRRLDELRGVSEDDAKKRIVDTLRRRGRTEDEINTYINSPEGRAAIDRRKTKGEGTKRKEGYAEAITEKNWIGQTQVPFLRRILKSNKQAAAELRKGKKSAKQLFDEAIATAEGGTPPPPGTPPGGAGTPAGGAPAGGTPAGGGPAPTP